MNIYVLELEHQKWYVGKTDRRVEVRFREHLDGKGSAWTHKHHPLRIHEQFEGDVYDEDKTTLKYMAEYGIQHVRGGSFVQVKLPRSTIEVIHKMLRGSSDQCFNCGAKDHWICDCPDLARETATNAGAETTAGAAMGGGAEQRSDLHDAIILGQMAWKAGQASWKFGRETWSSFQKTQTYSDICEFLKPPRH